MASSGAWGSDVRGLGKTVVLAKDLMRSIVRKRVVVSFGDVSHVTPASSRFGDDRGRPIDRYYIEAFLQRNAHAIRGDVMEVGGSTYTRRFGSALRSVQVLHATDERPDATLVGDLTRAETLPDQAVDCLICTQTLGFIFDVASAVEGIHRLLRPGGTVLVTVGGISQISRYDMDRWGDYWRFTDASLRRLFEPVFGRDVDISTFGNVAASIAFLQGIAVEDLPDPQILDTVDRDYQLIACVRATRR